jgi:tripartite-type tricarboxylate transporter receptor subunit TctC
MKFLMPVTKTQSIKFNMLKLIAAGLMLFALTAHANVYDKLPRNIQLVLSYGPGGVVDNQYRHFQQFLQNKGIQLNGIYKPGADGVLAMNDVLKMPKDGSALVLTAAGMIASSEHKLGKPVAEPLTITGVTVHTFITHPTGRYATFQHFETAIRNNDPKLEIGYHAVGNVMLMNQYFSKINVDPGPLRVPFKTPKDVTVAVIGGHVQSGIVPMALAIPLATEGKVSIVAMAGPPGVKVPRSITNLSQRWPEWKHPDGFVFAAPLGWSQETTDMWLAVLKDYLKDPETVEFYEKNFLGLEPFGPKRANTLLENARQGIKKGY